MKLYEVEGKQLLKEYGILIPNGWLKSTPPSSFQFPVIVKSQVLTGGRGKAGGIKLVSNDAEMHETINSILSIEIKGEKARNIYIEEAVNFSKELYLAIIMDRTYKSPVIIASAAGGVDIEETPQKNILSIPVNPLLGLEEYIIRRVASFLDISFVKAEQILMKLWNLFTKEQADLVEINPLFIDRNNNLIAGDAKIVLSGDNEKTKERLIFTRSSESFEERCQGLKVGGAYIGGEISIVASGAGLGMATLDIVSDMGGKVHSLLDLQGHVIHDLEGAKLLIQEIQKFSPKSFLFNFYFQVASCKILAEAIASELGGTSIPVTVRMKGIDLEEAKNKLRPFKNIFITENLQVACENTLLFAKEGI